MYAKKNSGMKVAATLLAIVLLISGVIGGTVAWLMDSTQAVTNTFTVGDVEITLEESTFDKTKEGDERYGTPAEGVSNDYPLIPGTTYKKDPVVTVNANSEDCYLFVKLEKVNNPDNYLTYTFKNDGWTTLSGEEGVYYREVAKATSATSFDLLTKIENSNDTIKVNDNIVRKGTAGEGTVEMPDASTAPKLIFTAYAVQKDNLDVNTAWNQVKPTSTP